MDPMLIIFIAWMGIASAQFMKEPIMSIFKREPNSVGGEPTINLGVVELPLPVAGKADRTDMTWRAEAPTEPGLYIHAIRNGNSDAFMLSLKTIVHGGDQGFLFCEGKAHRYSAYYNTNTLTGQWLGPIPDIPD